MGGILALTTIKSLQVFRGLAALAVVLVHASQSTADFVGALPGAVQAVVGLGYLGVDFFFVLSGFIIMYAHMADARSPAKVRRYILKRLVRIYPAYLPISIALLVLYALLPGFSASGGRDYSLASSLFLLPADLPPALIVAWSLIFELMFYAVFLLFFISRRCLVAGLMLWGGVIIASNLLFNPSGWLVYPLGWINFEFMLGVLAAWVVRSAIYTGKPTRLIVLGLAVVLVMLPAMHLAPSAYFRLLLALGLALVITGFALLEKSVSLPWPGWLLMMGNASYSIYLVHNPLLSVTQRLAGRMGLDWASAMLFGVALSLLAGYVYYLLVERRVVNYFQNRFAKPSHDALPRAPTAHL